VPTTLKKKKQADDAFDASFNKKTRGALGKQPNSKTKSSVVEAANAPARSMLERRVVATESSDAISQTSGAHRSVAKTRTGGGKQKAAEDVGADDASGGDEPGAFDELDGVHEKDKTSAAEKPRARGRPVCLSHHSMQASSHLAPAGSSSRSRR
jgi:hypothetical protein